MSTDVVPSKPKTLHKVINIFLLFTNASYIFGMISVSQFPDFQFHERVIIAVSTLLLAIFMVAKEFKVKPLLKRIYLNLLIFGAFFGVHYYVFIVW